MKSKTREFKFFFSSSKRQSCWIVVSNYKGNHCNQCKKKKRKLYSKEIVYYISKHTTGHLTDLGITGDKKNAVAKIDGFATMGLTITCNHELGHQPIEPSDSLETKQMLWG